MSIEWSERRPRTMSTLARVLLSAVAAVAMALGVAVPAQASPSSADDVAIVLQKINAARVAAGSTPLAIDSRVTAVAQGWAESMQSDQLMSHNPYFGQELSPATQAGEVVSAFYSSAGVVNAWLNSSTHRGILLSATWNAVGIGFIPDPDTGHYWAVVDFAYYPPATAPASAPPAPTSIDLSLTDRDATVTWAGVPGSVDPALARYDVYEVSLRDAATGSWMTGSFQPLAVTTIPYPGLQRGRSYYAEVRAYVNGAWGPSARSATVTVAALAPAAIVTTTIYPYDATSVYTSWWASPNDNGSPVTSYAVTLFRDGEVFGHYTSTESNRMFTDLPQGSSYAFTVSATNAAGTSLDSALSSAASLPVIPVQVDQSQIPPGAPVPSIESVVAPTTPLAQDVPTVPAPPPPAVTPAPAVPSAPPITAPLPASGGAPASAPQPGTPARPLPPTVTGVRSGKSTVAIVWRSASTSKAAVTRYEVAIRRVGTSQVHTYRTSASRSTLTLTGLRRHTSYRVTVTAWTSKVRTVAPARVVRTR